MHILSPSYPLMSLLLSGVLRPQSPGMVMETSLAAVILPAAVLTLPLAARTWKGKPKALTCPACQPLGQIWPHPASHGTYTPSHHAPDRLHVSPATAGTCPQDLDLTEPLPSLPSAEDLLTQNSQVTLVTRALQVSGFPRWLNRPACHLASALYRTECPWQETHHMCDKRG